MPQIPYSQPVGYSYAHLTGTATVVAKAKAGVLHRIIVNSATINAVVTIYDNTAGSGTVIGVYTFGAAQTMPLSLQYDGILFNTGLTLVSSVAAVDVTIMYT